jgi:hypothetical protein
MGNKNSNNQQKTNQAILDYSNGEKYRGEIVDGLRNGFGTYFYHNGERYEGNWFKNVKLGRGTFFYKNGGVYEGFWNNNKREGVGTYYNNNGDRYYGEWKDNKKHGKGILHMEDGSKFVGQFKNNKKQGFGEHINKDGNIIYEEWKDGVLVRQFEKPKTSGKFRDDINYHEFNTGAFEKYLDTKTKQQSELKSNPVKSKYFTLEFAKKLKSKNPDNYYDSVRLMHNINNFIIDKPDIMLWNIEEVAALFKKLGLDAFIEVANKYAIDGNKLVTLNIEELANILEMTDNREKKLLNNTIDFFKKYATKKGEVRKSITQTGIILIEEEQNINKSEDNSFEESTQNKEKDIEIIEKKIDDEIEKKESLNSPSNILII